MRETTDSCQASGLLHHAHDAAAAALEQRLQLSPCRRLCLLVPRDNVWQRRVAPLRCAYYSSAWLHCSCGCRACSAAAARPQLASCQQLAC